jgi:hypothetical protein
MFIRAVNETVQEQITFTFALANAEAFQPQLRLAATLDSLSPKAGSTSIQAVL